MRPFGAVVVAIVSACPTLPTWAQELPVGPVSGAATVIGSDILEINNRRFKLTNVDGLEFHQFCFVDGAPWACGASALRALQVLTYGVTITCTPRGQDEGNMEQLVAASCTDGNADLAESMLRQGWALARAEEDTTPAEEDARSSREGIWEGNFVEPWRYRADIAAIEAAYLSSLPETIVAEAQKVLLVEDEGLAHLSGFEIASNSHEVPNRPHQAVVPALTDGFVHGLVEYGEVFSWQAVAQGLADWRQSAVRAVRTDVSATIWTTLMKRPRVDIETANSLEYFAAMSEAAKPWLESGRQPVLVIVEPGVPSWIRAWLNDVPPPGSVVSQTERPTDPGYLGTIDGIDIYVGDAPEQASLLFPQDLLERVTYPTDAHGAILAVTPGESTGIRELRIAYGLGLDWRNDSVVWLHYPAAETEAIDVSWLVR